MTIEAIAPVIRYLKIEIGMTSLSMSTIAADIVNLGDPFIWGYWSASIN